MYGSLAFEVFSKRRSPRFKTNRVTLLRNDSFLKRLMTKLNPIALVRTFFVELVMELRRNPKTEYSVPQTLIKYDERGVDLNSFTSV